MVAMRFFSRLGACAITSLGLLALFGCAEDNEAEVKRREALGGKAVSSEPPPKNQREYFERMKKLDMALRGKGYGGGPGAAKGGAMKGGAAKGGATKNGETNAGAANGRATKNGETKAGTQ